MNELFQVGSSRARRKLGPRQYAGPARARCEAGKRPGPEWDGEAVPMEPTPDPSTPAGREESPAERRGHDRHQDPATPAPAVRYLVRPAFENRWALLVNVSAGGLGLLLGHEAAPGAVLLVRLTGARPGEALNRLARVAHARALPDGYWAVGCAFTRPLADDELAAVRWELGTSD